MYARTSILFFLLLTVLFLFSPRGSADGKPEMLYFYSKDCEHCQSVEREFLPEFLEKYGAHFTFRELDVAVPANMDSLLAMESRVGVPESEKDYPAVYFMGRMIEGEIPIRMRLASLVEDYLAAPDSMRVLDREVRARVPEAVRPAEIETDRTVAMAYFYKQGCKECGRAEEIIEWLKESYPFLVIDVFDIGEKRGKLLAAALGLRTGVPEKRLMSTPVFFIGGDYLLSEDISRHRLAGLVESYAGKGAEPYWRGIGEGELARAQARLTDMFRHFTVLAVAAAGLADGVNPCAFATILFFISYLGMVGRKRREILAVGLCFALAVFLTYFLVGLGFFNVVRQAAHIEILAKIIFGGTGVLCIVFGMLSVGDYFKARAGKVSDMSLQLPAFLKKRIHAAIREKTRMDSLVAGALLAGFMVSILEFACTGQVYLPTITLVVKQEGYTSAAVLYLLMYNLFFILPLLLVFGLVYFGISSRGIARMMETRVGSVKLGLAAVFFLVGGILIWTVV